MDGDVEVFGFTMKRWKPQLRDARDRDDARDTDDAGDFVPFGFGWGAILR
ncbi:MAG: hypothetical protein ACI8UO_006381 [Verrucomicrobiales bacterium]